VIGHEEVVAEFDGPTLNREERKAEGRRVGRDVDAGRHHAAAVAGIDLVQFPIEVEIVDILTVAKRPAIVPALFDNVDLVRRQVISQKVPPHLRDPDLLRFRMDGHEYRVP
jgi:hypothetical protein